jgi:hypothetical protein
MEKLSLKAIIKKVQFGTSTLITLDVSEDVEDQISAAKLTTAKGSQVGVTFEVQDI